MWISARIDDESAVNEHNYNKVYKTIENRIVTSHLKINIITTQFQIRVQEDNQIPISSFQKYPGIHILVLITTHPWEPVVFHEPAVKLPALSAFEY
jgi:hypothetical protein